MGLQEYRAKRNFRQTAEPAGRREGPPKGKVPRFVVQKHAASHLHYDFRLEMEGVLKSWAVPKGFPMRKGERRLAMQVEDHPLEYANFEGTIEPGNYGAGTVMVWDQGAYEVMGADPLKALEEGKLHLVLAGTKLKGEWALIRMRHPRQEGKSEWLLLKAGQDAPDISARVEDRSVLTKRSLDQIAEAKDAVWESNRPSAPRGRKGPERLVRAAAVAREKRQAQGTSVQASPKKPRSAAAAKRSLRSTATVKGVNAIRTALEPLPKAEPLFVEPMKALLVKDLPRGPEWMYEVKFDGFRIEAIKNKGTICLVSRNGKDLTRRFNEVAEGLRKLPAGDAVLDGEVVAVDEKGVSSFQLLQTYQEVGLGRQPLLYYVFDLVQLEGRDLQGLPLSKRKELLGALLAGMPECIRFSAGLQGDSLRLLDEMKKHGLEGVVAKRRDSKYQAGQRSGAWVKFKWSNEQEFVIGGYTPPKGERTAFGSVLVGYYENGKLIFASKVGSGFDTRLLKSLYERFQDLRRTSCPFANLPERVPGGLSASEMRRCTWVEPKLVCQVRFAEWTRDHHLRQPLFLGLREDKDPVTVVREQAR
jgi:bifunctional non-homologous end joining protein LigD